MYTNSDNNNDNDNNIGSEPVLGRRQEEAPVTPTRHRAYHCQHPYQLLTTTKCYNYYHYCYRYCP